MAVRPLRGVSVESIPISKIKSVWHAPIGLDIASEFTEPFIDARAAGKLWPDEMPKVFITDELMLIDGYHRIAGAKEAGLSEVLAVVVPHWTWDQWESKISERRKREEGVDFDGYINWLWERSDLIANEVALFRYPLGNLLGIRLD